MVSLRKTRHLTLGVLSAWQVYWETLHPLFEPLLKGIEVAADERDCRVLMSCSLYRLNDANFHVAWPATTSIFDFVPIGASNTDGIIVVSAPFDPACRAYISELAQTEHPIVSINHSDIAHCVLPDNEYGIHQALEHLRAHGHNRIAFVAGFEASHDDADSDERLMAYRSFMARTGLPVDEDLIVFGRHQRPMGRIVTHQLLDRGTSFSAVLASNDESAFGVWEALEERGMRIPEDIAVMSFDNIAAPGRLYYPLASSSLPLFEMGVQAVRMLIDRIEEKAPERLSVRVRGELAVHGSCGCLPDQPPAVRATWARPSRSQIFQELLGLFSRHAPHFEHRERAMWCSRWVRNWYGLQSMNDIDNFADCVMSLARLVEQRGDTTAFLHDLLLVLYPTIYDGVEVDELQNMGWLQAKRALVQHTKTQQMHQQIQSDMLINRLSLISARVRSVVDVHEILDIFAQHLSSIEVPHMAVALFTEPSEYDECHMYCLREGRAKLWPEPVSCWSVTEILNRGDNNCKQWVLVPLIVESEQVGFVAFDVMNLWYCGSIVWQLSSALRNRQLIQQAMDGQRLAEEANRVKTQFLAVVSHELRTPLSLITGLSDMILHEARGEDEIRRDIARIFAASQHLNALIGDVLDLTSSEAGELRLMRTWVYPNSIFNNINMLGLQFSQGRAITWQYDVPEQLPAIYADTTRLQQICINLITNAFKYTDAGLVRFAVRVTPEALSIVISDTGRGILAENQKIIFEEFQQVGVADKGGLGLGLAIVKRLVELHDGTIQVSSTGQAGAGATFTVALPVGRPNTVPSRMDNPQPVLLSNGKMHAPAEQTPRTILLIDDDPDLRDIYTRMFVSTSAHYSVVPAIDGREALELLEVIRPDLIILDLMMPNMDGFEVLEQLRRDTVLHQIPLVVATARTLTERELEQLQSGVAAIISKNVLTTRETLQRLQDLLEATRRPTHDIQQLVRRVMVYIHNHYQEPIARGDIARHACVSEDYMTRCFKQEVGISPITYLNRYRIHCAKTLLATTGKSMTEIALAVGFTDNVHFSRVFRREAEMTPSTYRNQIGLKRPIS